MKLKAFRFRIKTMAFIKPSSTYMRGQSLVEVIIGLGISIIMITAATSSLFLVLRSSNANTQTQIAGGLSAALLDNINALADSRWRSVYDLNRGSGNIYYIATSSGQFVTQSGEESMTVNNIVFRRHFFLDSVSRDQISQDIESSYIANDDDPSTLKVTVQVTWDQPTTPGFLEATSYLTRWNLETAYQTDWRGGGGASSPITQFGTRFASSTNITASSSIRILGL